MNPDSIYEGNIPDETKLVMELYKNCEEGQATNLKKDLENCFSAPKLDIATRRCIKKALINRRTYAECVNLLLVCVDINYRNPAHDNTTIFMFACTEGNYFTIEQICNFDFSQSTCKPNEKLNLNLKDNKERTFLHHLLLSAIMEDDAFELISRFVSNSDYKTRYINQEENIFYTNSNINNSLVHNSKKNNYEIKVKDVFNAADENGITPLAITLSKGWYKLSKYILMIAEERYLNKKDFNNYMHYAVIGRSYNCLNLILKESNFDDVRQKNKDGFLPADLAKKMDMNYFSKIIENFEEHCHNSNYFNIFSDKASIQPDKIFEKFIQEDYKEALFLLGQLNIIQSIKDQTNFSLEWNIILTKYHIHLDKESLERNRKDSFKISPESILSKFMDSNKDKNAQKKNEKKNFIKIFSDFFHGINTKNSPPCQYSSETHDLIMLNKAIFYFKLGDDAQTINIFLNYFKFYLDHKDYKYYKWVVYVSITLMFIEILIKNKLTKLVNLPIKKLEEFLFTRFSEKKDDFIDIVMIKSEEYLNEKEVVNNFKPDSTWDESFCLLNLYKAMKSMYENNIPEAKISFKEYKKLYQNCKYREDLPIFNSLYYLYICLKIKMFYYEDNTENFFKNLNKIHNLTKIENINLTINDQKIQKSYYIDPYILYYLNSMGIMYLKQKKFISAEIFFKTCIEHYKKIYCKIANCEFDFSIKLTDIFLIKYNLGLCYFYQKKYKEAYQIFKEIIKNKFINEYIFVWYRIGLCLLEIELEELQKLRENNTVSKYISKAYGYETNYDFETFTTNKFVKDTKSNTKTTTSTGRNIRINSSNKKANGANTSNFNSYGSNINSKSAKSNDNGSPKKNNNFNYNNNNTSLYTTNKDKDETWDTVKYLNENLKDTMGLTNIDDKVESVINDVNQIKENLINNQIYNLNRRRIILQNDIFSLSLNNLHTNLSNNNCLDNFDNNDNLNKSARSNEDSNHSQQNDSRNNLNDNIYDHWKSNSFYNININKKFKLKESIFCLKRVINIYRTRKYCKAKPNAPSANGNNNTNVNINPTAASAASNPQANSIPNLNNSFADTPAMEELLNFFSQNKSEKNTPSIENKNINNERFMPSIKSFNLVLNNAYLTLIFVHILDKNWVEALALINDFKSQEIFSRDKEVSLKLNNFLVEIYINMNRKEKAFEIIKDDLLSDSSSANAAINEKATFYSFSQNNFYKDTSYRIMLHSNIIKLHLMDNNIPEAEKCLSNLLETFSITSVYDIPPFVLNQIIYINLAKEKYDVVLNLVKFRRVNTSNLGFVPNILTDKITK